MDSNPPTPPPTPVPPPPPPPPITQAQATSAELTELLLLRTQAREFHNPISSHARQLTHQAERIELLEMRNQQLQTQMQMFWAEFDRRRDEGVREGVVQGALESWEEFVRLLKMALVVVVAVLMHCFLCLLLKILRVEGF
ncbi:uncharacterized protein EAF02_008470 [Botrytis sinoallii]|uniref:uncharacterized protein n=1 Tax=Botrytis sinoallii TaxID=1463999 RepID=UPI0019014F02|nr:uncharacterized protein EAF02_008470 [Botrytis sinoallii]KAF7874493.1 hypothetical protein EAF02_008470 [Botrytis sinoallii]